MRGWMEVVRIGRVGEGRDEERRSEKRNDAAKGIRTRDADRGQARDTAE